jgi:hypothetical protein
MKRRDIVIGLAILLFIIGLFYFRQRGEREDLIVPEETATDIESRIEERFGVEIPEDANKAELTDVAGGDGYALATRRFEDGAFAHSILADLPDPETGRTYQAWLVRGDEGDDDYNIVATGGMRVAKGGWVLEYQTTRNLEDHNRVLVTSERIGEQRAENIVLEGEFESSE